MRVNISYSVDLDEIPKKVLSFLEGVTNQLEDLRDSMESSVGAIGDNNYVVATLEGTLKYSKCAGSNRLSIG